MQAADLFQKIVSGDRVSLGQAMTLVESELHTDRESAISLLELCEKKNLKHDPSIRMAVSGAPGAGKSTLIEAVGNKAISEGHKVGVITVDPSSSISYGSILGDKSRMHRLSNSDAAFVRTSPAGSILGGIGRRSKEMMALLSAAGYDIIFLETVGVGQSEHIAWQLTDGFILLVQAGGGDELQGIKRGITELADVVVVTKADGSLQKEAQISKNHFRNALHYLNPVRNNWSPQVIMTSALENTGIDDLWQVLRLYRETIQGKDQAVNARHHQQRFWMQWALEQNTLQLILNHPVVNQKLLEGLGIIEEIDRSLFRTEYEIERTMQDLIKH